MLSLTLSVVGPTASALLFADQITEQFAFAISVNA
jgi:hypothetical protein